MQTRNLLPEKIIRPDGRWLHRFAVLTACVTFPLIFIGGLVTSHGAALAVPDWPTSYGYNMFLFPWHRMVGGIFYEHSHRLVASLVGCLTIILAVWLAMGETRRWVKGLGWFALALVIFQGVLGGLRVLWLNRGLAIFHACVAQSFFCLTVALALFTSRWWRRQAAESQARDHGSLRKWTLLTTLLIFAQLILGATMRHTDAGLAVPDFPKMHGSWIPPLSQAALDRINATRPWDEQLTLAQVGIHLAHRAGAAIVFLGTLSLFIAVWRHARHSKALFYPVLALMVLVLAQLMLGVLVIWTQKAADVATAHVAVGALTLATSAVLTLAAFKTLAPARRAMARSPAVAADENSPLPTLETVA